MRCARRRANEAGMTMILERLEATIAARAKEGKADKSYVAKQLAKGPLKIAQKLPLAMVVSALLVSAGVGTASYLIGSNTVDEMSVRQMQTVADERAKEFQTFLKTIEADVVSTASTDLATGAVRDPTTRQPAAIASSIDHESTKG